MIARRGSSRNSVCPAKLGKRSHSGLELKAEQQKADGAVMTVEKKVVSVG